MIIPGQQKIQCQHVRGDENAPATPVQVVQADQVGNVHTFALGGLTKLEHGVLIIVAHFAEVSLRAGALGKHQQAIVEEAVAIARATLAACQPPKPGANRLNGEPTP